MLQRTNLSRLIFGKNWQHGGYMRKADISGQIRMRRIDKWQHLK